ncbi:MAG: carboxypeptidase-like regulatory domain-containing protein, partial [Prevotellaceae bacterium]|nr:carboxypeptidase-like regulatory domain-containing protein [Prevotellaceae bacterium]
MCISVVSLSAAVGSQEAKVSIQLQNKPVNEVFDAIRAQTTYSFWFDIRDVDLEQLVSINVKNEPVMSVLSQALKSQNVDFNILGSHIIIAPKGTFYAAVAAAVRQDRRVTGTVVDVNDEPVIGANIMEKGTTNGTVTDVDGNFSLNVADNAVLQVSFVGYITQEISALA